MIYAQRILGWGWDGVVLAHLLHFFYCEKLRWACGPPRFFREPNLFLHVLWKYELILSPRSKVLNYLSLLVDTLFSDEENYEEYQENLVVKVTKVCSHCFVPSVFIPCYRYSLLIRFTDSFLAVTSSLQGCDVIF